MSSLRSLSLALLPSLRSLFCRRFARSRSIFFPLFARSRSLFCPLFARSRSLFRSLFARSRSLFFLLSARFFAFSSVVTHSLFRPLFSSHSLLRLVFPSFCMLSACSSLRIGNFHSQRAHTGLKHRVALAHSSGHFSLAPARSLPIFSLAPARSFVPFPLAPARSLSLFCCLPARSHSLSFPLFFRSLPLVPLSVPARSCGPSPLAPLNISRSPPLARKWAVFRLALARERFAPRSLTLVEERSRHHDIDVSPLVAFRSPSLGCQPLI